jgi:hypothetical protein
MQNFNVAYRPRFHVLSNGVFICAVSLKKYMENEYNYSPKLFLHSSFEQIGLNLQENQVHHAKGYRFGPET